MRYVLKSFNTVIQSTITALWDSEELHYSATLLVKLCLQRYADFMCENVKKRMRNLVTKNSLFREVTPPYSCTLLCNSSSYGLLLFTNVCLFLTHAGCFVSYKSMSSFICCQPLYVMAVHDVWKILFQFHWKMSWHVKLLITHVCCFFM